MIGGLAYCIWQHPLPDFEAAHRAIRDWILCTRNNDRISPSAIGVAHNAGLNNLNWLLDVGGTTA